MENLKLKILETIHTTSPIFPVSKSSLCSSPEEDSLDVESSIDDLISQNYIIVRSGNLYLTAFGLNAMEQEYAERERIAREEKQAKLNRRPQWAAFAISIVAIIVSIISICLQFLGGK